MSVHADPMPSARYRARDDSARDVPPPIGDPPSTARGSARGAGAGELPARPGPAGHGIAPGAGFAALCLLAGLLLVVKYYPLRPTTFVLSQYIWTVDVGDYRRAVLSSLAALAWAGDPARFLPVVDAVSAVEVAGLGIALAWGAMRAAARPVLGLALLLALCSGAAPHLLATRGSQDGFAALALVGLAVAVDARRPWLAAGLGALAVAIHEASVFYVASICGLHLLLAGADTRADPDAGWRRAFARLPVRIAARLAQPAAGPAFAGLAGAVLTLAAVMASTHMTPQAIDALCARHAWIQAAGSVDAIRNFDLGSPAQRWAAVCGLQFRSFSGSPSFVLHSVPLGAMFAPLLLATLALALRARLSWPLRLGAAGALLVPALLPLIATDVTRFWSYMNLTALYALALLLPHLRGWGRATPRMLLGALLALWTVVAVGIDQWPTGWPQPPGLLPNAVALRFPTFRDALCAASQSGLCDKPTTVFR